MGIGSIVAVKTAAAGVGPSQGNASPQPPCFGVSESASTPFTITWSNNGSRVASIPAAVLDEIGDPATPTLALLGQVVNLTASASPALNSLVVAVYSRAPAAGGSATDVVLMKSLQTGSYMEAAADSVTLQVGL